MTLVKNFEEKTNINENKKSFESTAFLKSIFIIILCFKRSNNKKKLKRFNYRSLSYISIFFSLHAIYMYLNIQHSCPICMFKPEARGQASNVIQEHYADILVSESVRKYTEGSCISFHLI